MPRDRVRNLTIIIPLIFFIAFFTGCNHTNRSTTEMEKAIGLVMLTREKAIKEKDIDLYMACISEDYTDSTDTFDVVKERMQKNFEVFDRIGFSTFERTVYLENQTATLVQDYELIFFVNGKSDRARGKERIFLRREDREWKIVKGL